MTPEQAAALLGVAPDAGEAAVRAAFRSRARAAHPDRGGAAADLSVLTEARDLLLRDATTASVPPTRATPTARRTSPTPSPPRASGGSIGRTIYAVVGAALALVVAGAIVIVVIAVASGDGDQSDEPEAGECLRVTDTGVVQTNCDAAGALRVVAEYSGARTCPPGSDSLIVGSTTWCLEPASP